ncbi:hypothetical protein HLB44_35645 [Aquincola sp. S2]|uniref:Prepilin-type N-terminal cleavage/methylation domain-containing protein n=1 Tax=Pseudaquabacterium terrae TaxID=2732868 RepID=A0ABX2EV14_9BURK|nr:hypothetical protein [Aquabacterium terrae]NRF72325.1 hypothetical protein [Aquabacterium terrae]
MLSLRPRRRGAPARARQRGLSIMELMIGATVGMIVMSGAVLLFAKNVSGSRMLLAETRLNQDLRNATDLLTRDLRRAGYWGNAILGTTAIGVGSVTTQNPYSQVTSPAADEVSYRFSRDAATDNNTLDNNEQFGFRIVDGALQMQVGSSWTDVTDKSSVTITELSVTPTVTQISLGDTCPTVCGIGTPNCPTTTVRSFAVVLHGQSVRDANVQRSLRSTVRVRNDQVSGACPA